MDTNTRVTAARITVRRTPWLWLAAGVVALGAAIAMRPAAAQQPQVLELASADELYDLVGPIALYPDDLVAIVLPASTYPLQVVQAARFLEDRERNPDLAPDEEWDDSILALLNYPEVLALLNDDLDWTYDLGEAVLNQRADVLDAIQGFRDEAYAAGNLRTDDRQTVARNNGTIEITPADPKVIYVPYYEPERVVVYQTAPVYYYYPRRYPVYYYPYPAHYAFDTGYFWGVRSWFSIGWHSHHVHLYDPFYHSHPYYGWSYYDPFYSRRNVIVNINVNRDRGYVWEPRYRYGGRPVVRGTEGRVTTADRTPRRGVLDSSATRTREGSVYRGTEQRSAATSRSTAGTQQPRRGVPSSAYRSRIEGTERATQQAAQADRATRTPVERSAAAPQQRAPSVSSSPTVRPRPAPTAQGTYRSGGGMSQALERSRAAAPSPTVSPRAVERSTGMPREAARSAPAPRESAPAASVPSRNSGVSSQRGGGDGGSYRGGGASQRGEHPAARGRERSAGR
jgi:hypothetical protein